MASHRNNSVADQNRKPQGQEPDVRHARGDLIQSLDTLTAAILQLSDILKGLGRVPQSRYSTVVQPTDDILDEQSMAQRLGITRRVLARHRKKGKLPGCWITNGRQTRWHVQETQEAWKRGIA